MVMADLPGFFPVTIKRLMCDIPARVVTLSFMLVLIGIALLPMPALALTLSVDRTTIALNETLSMRIVSDKRGIDTIDLSPIEQHFRITNRSQQSSFSIVNGQRTSESSLVLTLVPLQKGSFTIPPLTLGQSQSNPLKISVTDAVAPPSQLGDDSLFVEARLDKTEAYVNEQIIYTLYIYYRTGLQEAQLGDLTIANATVQELQDKRYQRNVRGMEYNVIEKPFALFFSKAGEVDVEGQELTVVLSNPRRSRFGFDPFSRGSAVKLAAESKPLTILPEPAHNKAIWLPASDVAVDVEWSKQTDIPLGEPISRKIILTVKGQHESTLPTFNFGEITGFNAYPEKPSYTSHEWQGGFAARQEATVVLIPTRPGQFEIPSIEIPWFNTQTLSWELASTPAHTINVMGEPQSAQVVNGAPLQKPMPTDLTQASELRTSPDENSNGLKREATNNTAENDQETGKGSISQTVISVALGVIAIFFAALWLAERHKNKKPVPDSSNKPANGGQAHLQQAFADVSNSLIRACDENNTRHCLQQLEPYRKALDALCSVDPSIQTRLDELSLRDKLDHHRAELNQSQYSASPSQWSGHALSATLTTITSMVKKLQRNPSRNKTNLPPLYPDNHERQQSQQIQKSHGNK